MRTISVLIFPTFAEKKIYISNIFLHFDFYCNQKKPNNCVTYTFIVKLEVDKISEPEEPNWTRSPEPESELLKYPIES